MIFLFPFVGEFFCECVEWSNLFLAYTLNQWKRTAFAQHPECTKKVYKITEKIVRQGRRLNYRPNWWKQIYDLHYLRRMWKLGVRVTARPFINSSKYSGVSTGVLASVHVNVFSHLACTKKSWNIHEKMNRLMKKKKKAPPLIWLINTPMPLINYSLRA